MIKDPAFWRVEGLPMAEHRERVLTQLHLLVHHGGSRRAFPEEYGGEDDHGGNVAGFQELVIGGPRRCRSSPASSGACSAPPSCTSAPRSTTTKWLPGDHEPGASPAASP